MQKYRLDWLLIVIVDFTWFNISTTTKKRDLKIQHLSWNICLSKRAEWGTARPYQTILNAIKT